MNEESIFSVALALADPERRRFLDDACAGDGALRAHVEALLAAHDASGFMDAPHPRPDDATAEHVPTDDPTVSVHRPAIAEGPGTTIGPYKLLQAIGEGGMGAVFMAEQEKPVRRKVALKVIKAGMDTKQVVARFEAERQALAMMDHPNIARVLDAGATDTGRPFFVMELVRGVPITEYCDRNHLTPKERLELFIPVCQAIQHAHQKGIIHRDIKPSNVLVTSLDGKPIPKVIDFGVAKAIDQRLTERTMFTEFGAVIGTLEYMSPEQAEMGALDIDTRSDIYSLGVLLYELLTGSTPLEREKLRRSAYSEILRRIREEEPEKPSTRVGSAVAERPTEVAPGSSGGRIASIAAQRKTEPARLSKLIRGDLDWIVMKSLEKDRTRRYETANALARDIGRHLAGDAVEAGPPSASYRLRKFARKHRAALATAGAFALLLVAATAVSAGLAYWANKERARALKAEGAATTQAARAEEREKMAIDAVKRFRDAVSDEPELKNTPALEGLRKRLLKEPLSFFRALRDRLQADHDTRTESLARLAQSSFDLGSLADAIGDKQDALIAYQESLAIRQKLADANPNVTEAQRDLANSLSAIGFLLGQIGTSAEALQATQSALTIFQKLADAHPSVAEIQDELANSHNTVGKLLWAAGKPTEALRAYEAGRTTWQKLVDANPTVIDFQSKLTWSLNNIGFLMSQTGKPDGAMKAYESALAIQRTLATANPGVARFQSELARTQHNIGLELMKTDKLAEALEAHRSALAIWERLAAANPAVTHYQDGLAASHNYIGVVLMDTDRLPEALEANRAALAIRRKLADANPTATEFQRNLATSHYNIGILLRRTGKSAEAREAYESALAIREKLAQEHPESPLLANHLGACLNNLANLDVEANRLEAARARFRQATGWFRKAHIANPASPGTRKLLDGSLTNLIDVARRLGDTVGVAEAERELVQLRDSDPAMIAVDARLVAAIKRTYQPRDNVDRLLLAKRAYDKTLHASAARFWAEALESDPKLGDDRTAQHRYNAACAAALAASGRSKDDPPPDGAAKMKLRAQALDWLRAELKAWGRVAMTAEPGNRELVAERMKHWKTDADLASIRDEAELARLPEAERAAFKALWEDVDRLLDRVATRK